MISEVCNLANSSRIETWYEPISVSKSTKCIAALKSGHLTYASPNYSELIELYHHLTGTNKKNASAEHSIHDISKFTQTLIQFGLKNCIAKIGKRGVVIAERSGNIEHIQAVNVPFEKIINMNGAGDTLVGSCVFGLLRGDNLIESAKRAVFASSLTIQSPFAISPEISPSTLLAL
jgi:sugar/nucleoside kinase (ribokinase family)